MTEEGKAIDLLYYATGERVITVMGAICVIKSKVSGIFIKNNSCVD